MCKKALKKVIGKVLKKSIKNDSGATIVEVAILIPMMWIVIMIVIFLLFFFLDMGALRSETIYAADRVASAQRQEKHASIGEEEGLLEKRLHKKLVLTHLESKSIDVSLGSVTARASVAFTVAGHKLEFSNRARAAIDNRETWFRLLSH